MDITLTEGKTARVRKLILSMLDILEHVGVPLDGTPRRLERMAMACLAVGGISKSLAGAKSAGDGHFLTTREIIAYENSHFGEHISPGSYDDIRRKDLLLPVAALAVINSSSLGPQATNNPTRGYALNPMFADLIRKYGTLYWDEALEQYASHVKMLREELQRKRDMEKIPVKLLYKDAETLEKIGFFTLEHDELPDVVAYCRDKNLLFLIEAVHSAGPMSEIRVKKLKAQLNGCTATPVFVTAFMTRKDFRRWCADIAWESEVWLAESPEHMIHFNGYKFLELHK